jgi:hypothetical protein
LKETVSTSPKSLVLPIRNRSWKTIFVREIGYFPFTLSFGFSKLVCHQHAPGSFVASNGTAPLTSPANQCERVALLRSLRLVHQQNSFEVPDVGRQTLSNDTFEKT